jgi:hypothetical protein
METLVVKYQTRLNFTRGKAHINETKLCRFRDMEASSKHIKIKNILPGHSLACCYQILDVDPVVAQVSRQPKK